MQQYNAATQHCSIFFLCAAPGVHLVQQNTTTKVVVLCCIGYANAAIPQ